jgi:hypothetical protein
MMAADHLRLAKAHLTRVQAAWDPPDWSDLALYGFYCLENAVVAAALHASISFQKTHPSKVAAARQLTAANQLPDIAGLLIDLNDARKSVAYGDVAPPQLDPEDVATEIEAYVEAVEDFLGT